MKRGELWIVDLEPGFGREMHKKRPALIISADEIHQFSSDIVIIPASSRVPPSLGSDIVVINEETGVTKPSVLVPLLIRSVDKNRLIKKIGVVSKETIKDVEQALLLVLDIANGLN